jgi:ABC-2 type transport system ATP-binding protein
MSEELAIETHQLTKKYDGITVVDNLNLRVKKNEVFGLLGPNGSGKTTIILMLLGLSEPASGSARIGGFDPVRQPLEVKRRAGYLSERVGFYHDLTARENLQFVAELNNIGYSEADSRIKELLEMVGLGKVADSAVGKFSRGMRQRLGIADVLIKKPEIVFLDEPTSGLDPEGINDLLELITGLPQAGTTVVLTSHLLYQVQKVCRDVAILSQGRIVIEGSIDDLGREAMAGGGFILEVETREPSLQLVDTIRNISGVIEVEARGNLLDISASADLRAEISQVVMENNFSLVQMKVRSFSLDDIYMKYFQEGEAGQ